MTHLSPHPLFLFLSDIFQLPLASMTAFILAVFILGTIIVIVLNLADIDEKKGGDED